MSPLLTALFTIAVYLLYKWLLQNHTQRPPGPRGWPFIGSVFEIPHSYQWMTFSHWASTYGSVVYLEVLRQPLVILNSAKVAKDLLGERSSIYSERPSLVMATLSGYGESIALQSYGDTWRQQRKMVAREFGPSTVRTHYSLQEAESRKLVHNILIDPANLAQQTELRIGTIIIKATYGHSLADENDPFLTATRASLDIFAQATVSGAWTVDFLPILKIFPTWKHGRKFLETAEQWRTISRNASWNPYLWTKSNISSGRVTLPNLCATALDTLNWKPSEKQEETLVWAASTTMAGGLDTSISSLMTFFLAMLLNPSVQVKAQREIDVTIGSDRLPVLQDRASLPYVRSIMAEVFRWRPPLPLGIPHAMLRDDVYQGMHLPKGTQVIPNIWHMLHDPAIYHNPTKFDPDRYENCDSKMEEITDIVFGFGRRVCPGKAFAEATIFTIIATVLATCEITPQVDMEGGNIMQQVAYTSGTITFPTPFNCNVKCRSDKVLDLLARGYTTAEEN